MLGLLFLALTACAPATENIRQPGTDTQPDPVLASADAVAAQATAEEAFHLMALAKLRGGAYTPNALADLALPPGVLWTMEAFGAEDYSLRVTTQALPGYDWLVTPVGVQLLTPATDAAG